MGFRDDRQIAACCIVLCRSVRLDRAWTLEGPSDTAIAMRDGETGASSGEVLVVRLCFDLWNGQGGATFASVLHTLDGTRMRMLATLLVAIVTDYDAIDRWLAEHGDPRKPRAVQ